MANCLLDHSSLRKVYHHVSSLLFENVGVRWRRRTSMKLRRNEGARDNCRQRAGARTTPSSAQTMPSILATLSRLQLSLGDHRQPSHGKLRSLVSNWFVCL